MKTVLKVVGGLVALIAVVALCGVGYVMFAYSRVSPPKEVKFDSAPERIARGKYLSDHVMGYRTRSANITPDADTGIGSWTEQQFIDKFKAFEHAEDRVLSEAEKRQNTPMPMKAYARMTREDDARGPVCNLHLLAHGEAGRQSRRAFPGCEIGS